jgi:hypothetical protein
MRKWLRKRRWENYINKVRKSYKELHKDIPIHLRGHLFFHIHRTETIINHLIYSGDGLNKTAEEIENKEKHSDILESKIKHHCTKIKIRKKKKLDYSEDVYERKMFIKEKKLIIDEIKLLKKELKNIPKETEAIEKHAKTQIKFLLKEIELFKNRYEIFIQKLDNLRKQKYALKYYRREIKYYLETLRKVPRF